MGFKQIKLIAWVILFPISYAVAAEQPDRNPVLQETAEIETVEVHGRQLDLLGEAITASEGVVGEQEIRVRPISRTGELLEFVPGMVVTQHSGTGKANQFVLRGFNLDHGTDFATSIDGMPVNMRSHGHGQGYTDLNFIIPETISQLNYRKGPYDARVGDFSGAGSAEFITVSRVQANELTLTAGEDNYARAMAKASVDVSDGSQMLFAGESVRYDGPWTDIDEDVQKNNLLAKLVGNWWGGEGSVSLMAYDNQWNSADQIPERAVNQGLIDEYGSLDTHVGGESSRYSINGQWHKDNWLASVYMIDYQLNLWSNFTYFLSDPEHGDQFEQVDDRTIYGGELARHFTFNVGSYLAENTVGVQTRIDDIDEVGLYLTEKRHRFGVIRSDSVQESSVAAYWQNEIAWRDNLRSTLGLRYDYYEFDVAGQVAENSYGVNLQANSGKKRDAKPSIKLALEYLLNDHVETYLALGQGLHSNDARGVTIATDPASGEAARAVDPLVRSLGYEIGARAFVDNKLNVSLALWALDLDSELVFVGDAGTTEAVGKSHRQGLEAALYYQIDPHYSVDLEYAYTQARLVDAGPENYIPGAVEQVLQAGFNVNMANWYGSLRLRYFGEKPLVEDGSVTAEPATVVNFRLARQWQQWRIAADVLNLTNSNDHDIDYYYESQLLGANAEEDVHFHPLEPRTVRISVSYLFNN